MISEAFLDRLADETMQASKRTDGICFENIREVLKRNLADPEYTHAQDPERNFDFYCGLSEHDGVSAKSEYGKPLNPSCSLCRIRLRQNYLKMAAHYQESADGLA